MIRKAFSILLSMFMLSPVFSSAELNHYDFDGLWSCYIYEKDPDAINDFKLFQFLFDDYHVFYYSYCFDFDRDGNRYLHPVGYSEYTYSLDNDIISFQDLHSPHKTLFTGKWVSGNLYVSLDNVYWYRFYPVPYQSASDSRFSSETVPDAFPGVYEKLESGFEIPAGIYIIGKDIPAGDYEITAISSTHIIEKMNPISSKVLSEFNMSSGDKFGKISLRVGEIFSFSPGSIILKNYHGLFND